MPVSVLLAMRVDMPVALGEMDMVMALAGAMIFSKTSA